MVTEKEKCVSESECLDMRILVLSGGDSPEREVSIRSGDAVLTALNEAGYETFRYDPIEGDDGLKTSVADADIVFPILHGVNGEDGVIQKKLEDLGKPFLGSTSEVSALTFDKELTHEKLEEDGILMPRRAVVSLNVDHELFKTPFVLKPINGGSSVDTLIAHVSDAESLTTATQLLEKYDKMLLEELVVGQEITVPVVGNEALPVILIIPPEDGVFDYENKYNGKTSEICPVAESQINNKLQSEAQNLALQVHKLVGARHLSRTDMILTPDGRLFVLEINTMPGMTAQSLLPNSANVAGMDMPKLVTRFIKIVQETEAQ